MADKPSLMTIVLNRNPTNFTNLIHTVAADHRDLRHRLISLLLSPPMFSDVFTRIQSLSHFDKINLLARLLLRVVHHLAVAVDPKTTRSTALSAISEDHLDAAVVLLAMVDASECNDVRCFNGEGTGEDWRGRIEGYVMAEGVGGVVVDDLNGFRMRVDMVERFHLFLHAGKLAAAAVEAFSSLEDDDGIHGKERCVFCWEDVEGRRDGCETPCGHKFHRACIGRWLTRSITCPACQVDLLSVDVFVEINRLMRVLAKPRI